MAKVTIKVGFKDIVAEMKKKIKGSEFQFIKDSMTQLITRGVSPVRGAGRFERYSESYREAIKNDWGDAKHKVGQVSPVNLTLFGEMLDSLEVYGSNGKIIIEFKDPKAYFHNNSGAGRSRVIRRILPDRDGEEFSRQLQQMIIDKFNELIQEAVKEIS